MAAQYIGRAVFQLTMLNGDYLLHHEKRAQIQWERKHESLGRLLKQPGFGGFGEQPTLTVLRAHHLDSGATFARLVATYAAGRTPGGRTDVSLEFEQRLVAQLLIQSQDMTSAAYRLASQSDAEMRNLSRRLVGLTLVVGASIAISAFGTWLIFAWRVVRPLRELQRGIAIVGSGNLDHRIGGSGRDEIGEVARAFDEMAENLKTTTVSRRELEQQVVERTAELATANRELEQFAHSIAHDVRAPLRAMDGFAHALLEEYADKLGTEGRSYAERVRAGSQRMALLLDDLLKLSSITRGELDRREVDLSELARKTAAELQRTAPERKVAFDIAPGIVANGDERLLEVVIVNLLDNAWKFTSKHRRAKIEFGVTNQKGKPAYYVRDDGAGFDMDYAEKLFQPFQRLHRRDEFPGTGIGLATVRRIVERHGGEVWITAGVEQGATACFTFSTPSEA